MYRKFDIRDYQINRDDDYIFDKNGNFVKKIERKGPHRLGMPDKDGRLKYYEFADQVNDPKNAGNEYYSKVIPVSKFEMLKAMGKRGAMNNANRQNKWTDLGLNSFAREKYDYLVDYLYPKHKEHLEGYDEIDYTNEYGEEDFKSVENPLKYADNVFFIPEGDGYAHNTYNFGNFLWGASGRSLGFDERTLKRGADIHNRFNPRSGAFLEPDSPDDQFSISRGVSFANKNDLYNKVWDEKNQRLIKRYLHPALTDSKGKPVGKK